MSESENKTHKVILDGCDDESLPMSESVALKSAEKMNDYIVEEHGAAFPHRAHAVPITQ